MSDHVPTARNRLCRAVVFGLPVLAAAITLSAFHIGRTTGNFMLQSALGLTLLTNAAVATIGAASAAIFVGTGQRMRLTGSVMYAIMAFLLYLFLTVLGIRLLGG